MTKGYEGLMDWLTQSTGYGTATTDHIARLLSEHPTELLDHLTRAGVLERSPSIGSSNEGLARNIYFVRQPHKHKLDHWGTSHGDHTLPCSIHAVCACGERYVFEDPWA